MRLRLIAPAIIIWPDHQFKFQKYIGANASEDEKLLMALHLSVAAQQAKRSRAGACCLLSE